MRSHYSVKHRGEFSQSSHLWRKNLWIQAFSPQGRREYFEVDRDIAKSNNQPSVQSAEQNTSNVSQRVQRIQQQLREQVQQHATKFTQSLEMIQKSQIATEVSPWLQRTKWIEHLQGYNLQQIAKLVEPLNKKEGDLQTICNSFRGIVMTAKQSIEQGKINHFDTMQINNFSRHKSLRETSQHPACK